MNVVHFLHNTRYKITLASKKSISCDAVEDIDAIGDDDDGNNKLNGILCLNTAAKLKKYIA